MTDQPTPPAYNPAAHVQRIKRGRGSYDYVAVKDRVLWFKTENPDSVIQIDTVLVDYAAGFAVVKATVSAPGHGLAEGLGSCSRAELAEKIRLTMAQPDQADAWVEFAETAAIGRALAHLGYGTEAALLELRPVDAPHQRQDDASDGQDRAQPQTSQRQNARQATTAANSRASDSPMKRAKKACWDAVVKHYTDESEALSILAALVSASTGRLITSLDTADLTAWEKLAADLATGRLKVPEPTPAPLFSAPGRRVPGPAPTTTRRRELGCPTLHSQTGPRCTTAARAS